MATDWFGSILKLNFLRTYLYRDGYLKYKFLNSTQPVICGFAPYCLGFIADFSSIIPKTVFAAYFALEILGI